MASNVNTNLLTLALGSNVTLAPDVRAGSCASSRGSMRTVPIKYSAGPLAEGCEPLLLMSISLIPSLDASLVASRQASCPIKTEFSLK